MVSWGDKFAFWNTENAKEVGYVEENNIDNIDLGFFATASDKGTRAVITLLDQQRHNNSNYWVEQRVGLHLDVV